MVGLLTFASSRAFSTGSAGKVRKAAIDLLKVVWAKNCQVGFFFKIYIFYKNIFHFNLQNIKISDLNNRNNLPYLFCTTLMLSYGLRIFFLCQKICLLCQRKLYRMMSVLAHACLYFEILPNKPHFTEKSHDFCNQLHVVANSRNPSILNPCMY